MTAFHDSPDPYSKFILCAWYTIWVSIPIESHVLNLFLAFITLSDLYYPHHPPPEGCTFRRQKKAFYTYRIDLPPEGIGLRKMEKSDEQEVKNKNTIYGIKKNGTIENEN